MKTKHTKNTLILLILIITLCFSNNVFSQEFDHAAGIRLGHLSSINYKNFRENKALEVMLGGYRDGLQVYVLHEWYREMPIGLSKGFYWYYGAGGHAGYTRRYSEKYYYQTNGEVTLESGKKTYYSMGFDGIAGIEYRIYSVPILVSVDIMPILDFYGLHDVEFNFWNLGISVKYIF